MPAVARSANNTTTKQRSRPHCSGSCCCCARLARHGCSVQAPGHRARRPCAAVNTQHTIHPGVHAPAHECAAGWYGAGCRPADQRQRCASPDWVVMGCGAAALPCSLLCQGPLQAIESSSKHSTGWLRPRLVSLIARGNSYSPGSLTTDPFGARNPRHRCVSPSCCQVGGAMCGPAHLAA